MKTLRKIGIFLVVFILMLVVISFFLPSQVHVERTTVINAQPSIIYEQVNDLKNWPKWAPWFKLDPNMQVTYDGPESGTGASYSWKGNKDVGEGKLSIIESKPDDYLAMAMDFMGHGTATADFKFEKVDGGTKVTWGMDSNMGMNPVGKYFGLFMDQMVGGDFEKGLNDLKRVSESYSPSENPVIRTAPGDSTNTGKDSMANKPA